MGELLHKLTLYRIRLAGVVPDHATFDTLERNLNAVAARRGELVLTVPMALFEARK